MIKMQIPTIKDLDCFFNEFKKFLLLIIVFLIIDCGNGYFSVGEECKKENESVSNSDKCQSNKIMKENSKTKEEDNDKWSGTVRFDNNETFFESQGKIISQFSLSEVKVIGEMTVEADPVANDWFLIFIDKNNEAFYIPVYANNMDNFLKQIGDKLNAKIIPKFFSSTDFDSNVIYPEDLSGEKLFEFKEVEPINILEKIGKFLGFGKRVSPVLTETVREYKAN